MYASVSGEEPPSFSARQKFQLYITKKLFTKHCLGLLTFAFVFLGSISLHAGLFSYVDSNGTPKLTDDFFELPQKKRSKLLKVFEQKASQKYTQSQINRMKVSGDWPPLEIIRESIEPALKKNTNSASFDYDAMRLAAQKLRARITYQRTSLNRDKKRVRDELPQLTQKIAELKKQEFAAHTKDVVNGSVGKSGFLSQLKKQIKNLKSEQKALLKLKNGGLRNNERRINRGELVYRD